MTSVPPHTMACGYGEDSGAIFSCHLVRRDTDVPGRDRRAIEVAILDMHHEWPNLGLDSLVRCIAEVTLDLQPLLASAGLRIRVLSYDVRRSLMVPSPPGQRHRIYIGSGGPGHVDPKFNDGRTIGAQGILENPAWERPVFELFDAICSDGDAVLLAVCHTFGVLCRWAGIARPVLRGAGKGGKSSGIVRNWLTDEAMSHPWFSRFSSTLDDGRHFSVLDSRLFDLIAESRNFPHGVLPLSYEDDPRVCTSDNALTMVELARDREGVLPRILAVNHHPEIRDRRRQRRILQLKLARGEVTNTWHDERERSLSQGFDSPEAEPNILLTSQFTLVAPLRFYLYRQVRLRAEEMGVKTELHEDLVLSLPSGILDRNVIYE